jgi:predicted CXXCH cytochrome family protein
MARLPIGVVVGTVALAVAGAYAHAARPGAVRVASLGPEALYTGSESCQRCHEAEYDSWRRTLHVQMTRPIAQATVVGDFSPGTRLEQDGRAYTMETRGGKYFISIARNGGAPEKFEVHYTLGARRFQGYLSRLSDGRIYVLPVFWHNESGRWVDYKTITPIPDDPSHDLRQIWNVTCVNCHATNLVRNYDVATNRFATTWTEMGVGCEACHGPGREHIEDPDHLKVFTMKKVAARQLFDACGYCHGNKNNVFLGFRAGDRYEDYAVPFLISEPIPANDPQGDFWPDGRPSRFNRPQALTLTGCFRKGDVTCTNCHRMHGTQNNHALKVAIDAPGGGHTRESDTLCTQCHSTAAGGTGRGGQPAGDDRSADVSAAPDRLTPLADLPAPIPDIRAHTHHAPESQGSRCINCHMSDVNWRLLNRRLDHTFQAPVPELTARFGIPNACTTCHEDRAPEWAAAVLDEWYGNEPKRSLVVSVADTMYRAGAGDVTVLPQIASLAVDRRQGALIRASAAEFAGRLIAKSSEPGKTDATASPGIVNALIGAASDSEPMVRATAVRSVGMLDDPRVVPVLFAKLVDPARVVRVRSAEALLSKSITTADGSAGEALIAAQDEWITSLRTFDDVAVNHVTLGRLAAARGRDEEAVRELNVAAHLDPADARPHVWLGVFAARAGRFDAAIQQFKAAKSLAPEYPNIDRLIQEASKRR